MAASVAMGAGSSGDAAAEIPSWNPAICSQCGKCVIACPQGALRAMLFERDALRSAPDGFKFRRARLPERSDLQYSLQLAVADCSGCAACVDVCPGRSPVDRRLKAMRMRRRGPWESTVSRNWEFAIAIRPPRHDVPPFPTAQSLQFRNPHFVFPRMHGGRSAYLELLSRLFGNRIVVAKGGRGSAIENAMSLRRSFDGRQRRAAKLVECLRSSIGSRLASDLLSADQRGDTGIAGQRRRVGKLVQRLRTIGGTDAAALRALLPMLVRRTIWAVVDERSADFSPLMSSALDVNVLLLHDDARAPLDDSDTDLAAIRDGRGYVASVALGVCADQAIRAFAGAEAHAGPSLIFAFPSRAGHEALDLRTQRAAIESGYWLLFRYAPPGEGVLTLDSPLPRIPVENYLEDSTPSFVARSRAAIARRWRALAELAGCREIRNS